MITEQIQKNLLMAIGASARSKDSHVVFRCGCGAQSFWEEGVVKDAFDLYTKPCCGLDKEISVELKEGGNDSTTVGIAGYSTGRMR